MSEVLALASPLTGEPLRESLLHEADQRCKTALEQASARYAGLEQSTWLEKRRQALNYLQSGNAIEAPALEIEARAYMQLVLKRQPTAAEVGGALSQLAQGISTQAEQIEAFQSLWIAWRNATRGAIAALPIANLSSFQFSPPLGQEE